VRQVHKCFSQKKVLAYTTIATLLQRLYDKGFVTRTRTRLGFTYRPKCSKQNYTTNLAQSFLQRFITAFGDVALVSFAESIGHLPKAERDRLIKLLNRHGK
jgi:predicted transcriptional regulator